MTSSSLQLPPAPASLRPTSGNAAIGAANAGAPTGTAARSNAAAASQTLSAGSPTPCKTCNRTNYGIAFRIRDAEGRLCNGMYYSVSSPSGHYPGMTDENGLTQVYYGASAQETIWLYIGHRDPTDDTFPPSPSTKEWVYDEAPLAHDTFDAVQNHKISEAQTKRLWKPWTVSAAADTLGKNYEVYRKDLYDLGDGGKTAGYGHFMPYKTVKGKIVKADTPEMLAWQKKYPNGISEPDASTQYSEDKKTKARVGAYNNTKATGTNLNVPLYQREFDALMDMRFNGGSGITSGTNGFDENNGNPPGTYYQPGSRDSMLTLLNRGRYKKAGDMINSLRNLSVENRTPIWNKGVQNRRDDEQQMFEDGDYTRDYRYR